MNQDQEHQLLQRVLADLDSDQPRLVMADWYEQQGCPRGEFIRVQCALAQFASGDPHSRQLLIRQEELKKSKIERPFDRVIAEDRRSYRRGFVALWHCQGSQFFRMADTVFARAPIEELRVGPPGRQWRRFFRSHHITQLRGLALDGLRSDLRWWLAALQAREPLVRLRKLSLSGDGPSPEAVDLAALSRAVPQLKSLTLDFFWDVNIYRQTHPNHHWLQAALSQGALGHLQEATILLSDFSVIQAYWPAVINQGGLPEQTLIAPGGRVKVRTEVRFRGDELPYY